MTLVERIQQTVGYQANSVGALLGLKEYLINMKNKIMRWSAAESIDRYFSQSIQIAIKSSDILNSTIPLDVHDDILAYVTGSQYHDAIEGVIAGSDTIELLINDSDTITVTSDVIMDAVETTVSNVTAQSEFVDYVLTNDSVSKAGFATYMASAFSSIPTSVINTFAEFLKGGDALQALNLFIQSVKLNVFTKKGASGNEYVEVTDVSLYTGTNIYLYALEKIWNTITSFFDLVWEGLSKIGEFLLGIVNGIVNLTKWLISLAFKQLTSRFEKVSNRIGIVDFPLFQMKLADVYENQLNIYEYTDSNVFDAFCKDSRWLVAPSSSAAITEIFSITAPNLYWPGTTNYFTPSTNRFGAFLNLVTLSCFEYVNDEKWVTRPLVEYFTGSTSSNDQKIDCTFAMVLGITSDHELVLQIFPVMPYASISSLTDKEAYNIMVNALKNAICDRALQGGFPALMSPTSSMWEVDQITNLYNLCEYNLFKPVPSDGPDWNIDIAQYCPASDIEYAWTDLNSLQKSAAIQFLYALLGNSAIYGAIQKNNQYTETGVDQWNWLLGVGGSLVAYTWNGDCPYSTLFREMVNNDSLLPQDDPDYVHYSNMRTMGLYLNNEWGFVPYNCGDFPITAIHYQTLDEAASEVITTIVLVLVAAAAAFITIKFMKWRKKRLALGEISQGYVDNMAWNLPQNPSQEQLKTYIKARNKARRVGRVNRLLGVCTNSDHITNVKDTLDAVQDSILSLQGKNPNSSATQSTAVTFDYIAKLITG